MNLKIHLCDDIPYAAIYPGTNDKFREDAFARLPQLGLYSSGTRASEKSDDMIMTIFSPTASFCGVNVYLFPASVFELRHHKHFRSAHAVHGSNRRRPLC